MIDRRSGINIFSKIVCYLKLKSYLCVEKPQFIPEIMLAISQNSQEITAKIFGSLNYFDRQAGRQAGRQA